MRSSFGKLSKVRIHFIIFKGCDLSFEIVERLQESHKVLEKNNAVLLQELESANQRLRDQQRVFEEQVSELTEIFERIKGQTAHC